MRSEALDIGIEARGSDLWVVLSGPFHKEQVPNIREKLTGLVEDGNRQLVVDLQEVTEIEATAVEMFVSLLNLVKGKEGSLRLVFRNDIVAEAPR